MEDIREHPSNPRGEASWSTMSPMAFYEDVGQEHGEWMVHRTTRLKVQGNVLKNPIKLAPSEQLQAWLTGTTPEVPQGPGVHRFEHHKVKKQFLYCLSIPCSAVQE